MLVGGYTVLQLQANRVCLMRGGIDITPLKQSPRPTKVSHMRGIKSISSPRWAGLPSKVPSESNYKRTLGCTGKITAINPKSYHSIYFPSQAENLLAHNEAPSLSLDFVSTSCSFHCSWCSTSRKEQQPLFERIRGACRILFHGKGRQRNPARYQV